MTSHRHWGRCCISFHWYSWQGSTPGGIEASDKRLGMGWDAGLNRGSKDGRGWAAHGLGRPGHQSSAPVAMVEMGILKAGVLARSSGLEKDPKWTNGAPAMDAFRSDSSRDMDCEGTGGNCPVRYLGGIRPPHWGRVLRIGQTDGCSVGGADRRAEGNGKTWSTPFRMYRLLLYPSPKTYSAGVGQPLLAARVLGAMAGSCSTAAWAREKG